jgi:hypothetical protein
VDALRRNPELLAALAEDPGRLSLTLLTLAIKALR